MLLIIVYAAAEYQCKSSWSINKDAVIGFCFAEVRLIYKLKISQGNQIYVQKTL